MRSRPRADASSAILEDVLTGWGVQTLGALDVNDALGRLTIDPVSEEGRIDFAIADADFQSGDGLEAARVLHRNGRIPVIVLLRTTELAARARRCREWGLAALPKPISPTIAEPE